MKTGYSGSSTGTRRSADASGSGRLPLCVMVGPSDKARGGMASVIATYRAAGLFDDGSVLFIPTQAAGSRAIKFATAVSAIFRYLAVLLRGGGQILHVHSASGTSFARKSAFILLAIMFDRKVLLHIHGGGFIDFYETRCSRPARAAVRWILRSVDQIACLSSRTAAWINGLRGGSREIAGLLPNPVAVAPAEGRARGEREEDILYIGLLAREKGVFDLVRAFSLVREQVPGARLILAGSGDRDELTDLAGRLGCKDSVQIFDWVGPEVRDELLGKTRVLALPSYFEGQPIVILEAMASGALVVASDVGGIPDLVTHMETGLLVEPGDVRQLAEALVAGLALNPLNDVMTSLAHDHVAEIHEATRVNLRLHKEYARLTSE